MARALLPAVFFQKCGTVLARLWESCAMETLLRLVWKLCWKISVVIKASIAFSRCQRDSCLAAAEMDAEVERSSPADNCMTTEDESTARSNDLGPRDMTLVPAAQQHSELAIWKNYYIKVRTTVEREDRLGTVRESPEECLAVNEARNTRRHHFSSARPLGRGTDLPKESGRPIKRVTTDTSYVGPSEGGDVGDYATKRDCRKTPTELLRDKETLRPFQVVQGYKKRDTSLPPKVGKPSGPQVEAACVARKATSLESRTNRCPSSGPAKLKEPKASSRRRSRAGLKPRPVDGKVSVLGAETQARRPVVAVKTPTSSPGTSKRNTKLPRRSSRKGETKNDPLANTHSERKPGLRRSSEQQSRPGFTLAEKRQRSSRGECLLESPPPPARSSRAGYSGRRASNRNKKAKTRSRPPYRNVQKSCESTDDGSVNEPSTRSEKPLRQRHPKRRDRSQASGYHWVSRDTANLPSSNSRNVEAKTTRGTGSQRTAPGAKTTEANKPGPASEAVPRRRCDRRFRRSQPRRGPTTKRLTGKSQDNSSVLPGVVEEPQSLTSQPSAQKPLAVRKDTEGHEDSSQPSSTFRVTPLASSMPSCSTSECSTSLDAQDHKAIVRKQCQRSRNSKYSKHVQESWEQWCKEREKTFRNDPVNATASNSLANGREASLATTKKATGSSLASAASMATCASGTGGLARAVNDKLPKEPVASTSLAASTQRTLMRPCPENASCSYFGTLSSCSWPVSQSSSCFEALPCSCFVAVSCSCCTDLSRSCFGLHGVSQKNRNIALVENNEVAVILDLSGRNGPSFWPFCRKLH
ncbi:hypothetical protein V5799_031334 [Amblyomma americanum]|uniref:Uncharacterized protein n=1 Tax=Amblyomma americanum TaxID=6943 RepID=A0AAQ4EL29_AMBAM